MKSACSIKHFTPGRLLSSSLRWCQAGSFFSALAIFSFCPTTVAQPFAEDIQQQYSVLKPYQRKIETRLNKLGPLVNNIFKQLEEKSLPLSLVLVPMLESSYNANAVSHAKAAGLWQLIPATAKRFGLQVTQDQDQRFDNQASTQAALSYFQFLYHKFDNDVALTLAAYNAGEGRVSKAIKSAGSTQYSQLTLPEETKQYINRFYALLEMIDIDDLKKSSLQPFFLFNSNQVNMDTPLIDLSPLPPLITL
ncbi:lytic transglycosylase domain-containing protein [Vibrio mimicus]